MTGRESERGTADAAQPDRCEGRWPRAVPGNFLHNGARAVRVRFGAGKPANPLFSGPFAGNGYGRPGKRHEDYYPSLPSFVQHRMAFFSDSKGLEPSGAKKGIRKTGLSRSGKRANLLFFRLNRRNLILNDRPKIKGNNPVFRWSASRISPLRPGQVRRSGRNDGAGVADQGSPSAGAKGRTGTLPACVLPVPVMLQGDVAGDVPGHGGERAARWIAPSSPAASRR